MGYVNMKVWEILDRIDLLKKEHKTCSMGKMCSLISHLQKIKTENPTEKFNELKNITKIRKTVQTIYMLTQANPSLFN